jgi:hypothetical protein
MTKLKIHKTFIKGFRKKFKNQTIRIETEKLKSKRTNVYFWKEEREKKRSPTINCSSFVVIHRSIRKRTW